ncbi:efflux RND transporter periplasmic adaptor subunit [Aegicerativicinus sediminis]|uniref:efflux RND transporter periplasmic adaptor subunit n=1 Tax=Aegicerativicinus sediminis TaxID=2893202 RepID=UPI001E4788BD|nr:efflux RND transporter periplasmic adaptor subunit [Aegicerativicinus sediminis]
MKKANYIIAIMSFMLLLFSCGGKKENKHTSPTPVLVHVASVSSEQNESWVSASGKIEAVNSANLSTRSMGFVEKIYVKVGDKVSKGDLVIRINNSDLSAKRAQTQATIVEAKAAYANAQKDYNRFKNLFAENSATQKELDDITAKFEMAQARLEVAKQMEKEVDAQFAYSNIRAPFSGIITNKFIDEGAMANPGIPLISIEGAKAFEAKVSIPESEITNIKNGDTTKVHIKSNGVVLNGVVNELSTSARNTGGQYLATVELVESHPEVLSGMYVNVQFPVHENKARIEKVVIPKSAIVNQGQLSGIYTVSESNTALLRWVRIGKSFGDTVEVLSGLRPDENYIVSAEGKLYNGVPVSVQ